MEKRRKICSRKMLLRQIFKWNVSRFVTSSVIAMALHVLQPQQHLYTLDKIFDGAYSSSESFQIQSFYFQTGCHLKVKEPSLPCCLIYSCRKMNSCPFHEYQQERNVKVSCKHCTPNSLSAHARKATTFLKNQMFYFYLSLNPNHWKNPMYRLPWKANFMKRGRNFVNRKEHQAQWKLFK